MQFRGVGRIFEGGFHDPPAKLRGRGYATCACTQLLFKQERRKRGRAREAIIYFRIIETAVSSNRYGAPTESESAT